jgi:hypothetical protein
MVTICNEVFSYIQVCEDELDTNVSGTVSVSITRRWRNEWCNHMLYLYPQNMDLAVWTQTVELWVESSVQWHPVMDEHKAESDSQSS